MKLFIWVSLLICLLPPSFTEAKDRAHYFEPASDNFNSNFCVRVDSVFQDSPASKAGLRHGDIIIALDGFHIRNGREYDFIQEFYKERQYLSLKILRNKTIRDLTVTNLEPGRMAGFRIETQDRLFFVKFLQSLDIDLEVIIGEELPLLSFDNNENNPSAFPLPFEEYLQSLKSNLEIITGEEPSLLRFDNNKNDTPVIPLYQPLLSLSCFPARGQEAMFELLAADNSDDKEWALSILQVYCSLLKEEHDEAARIIEEKKLLERQVDPFLTELLQFYKSVIDRPVSLENGIPLEFYSVNIPFFAICYPYPLRKNRDVTKSFASTAPNFQEMFDKATSGLDIFSDELFDATMNMPLPKGSSDTERYIRDIKRAIMHQGNHGGWPYRSSIVVDKETRQDLLSDLKLRMDDEDNPERLITAFAILAPSVITPDTEAFSKAYKIIHKSGYRELACANSIIMRTCDMWQLDYQSLKDFLSRMEKENKPVFYKYIETIDPFFKGKTSYGTCLQDDSLIVDLSFYCFENSWMISDALKNMMADKLNKLILIKHSFIMSSHLLVNFPLMPRWLVLILDFLKEESDFSMKLYDYCNYLLIYYGSEMPFVQYASSQNENSSDFAENAVDGYEDTIWHTQWEGRMARHPHEIQIDLKKRMKFKGFSYLPRQDGSENGTIKEYEFYVSNDGKNWGNPVSKGSFDSLARAKMEQRILFNEPVKARYFRLVALSEINGGPWASAAEIGVIPVGEDTNE